MIRQQLDAAHAPVVRFRERREVAQLIRIVRSILLESLIVIRHEHES